MLVRRNQRGKCSDNTGCITFLKRNWQSLKKKWWLPLVTCCGQKSIAEFIKEINRLGSPNTCHVTYQRKENMIAGDFVIFCNFQLRPMGLQWNMSIFKFFSETAKNRVTVHKKSTNQASWIFSTSFALNSLNLTNPLACIHEPSFHLQQNPIIQFYTRSSHLIRYSTEVSTKTFLSKVDSL